MNTLSWNCRGSGSLGISSSSEKPDFLFLCETIENRNKLEWISNKLGFEGLVTADPQGRSGGIALLWKEEHNARLLSFSRHHIDMEINIAGLIPWHLTGLYGEPDRAQRKKTWDLLRHLAQDSNLPWCCIGDLNNVVSQADKYGGAPYPQWLIEGFNETLLDTGVYDMNLVGHQYTWERGRGTEDWTEVRLDRVFTNSSWIELFPLAKLYNLESSTSYHSPLLLIPQ